MRIIFVRHAYPDYENDCITPLGHKQAAAAAIRLESEGIEKIYSSPMGRAQETAGYTAQRLGLDVEVRAWMHEIGGWGPKTLYAGGNPWYTSWRMVEEGQSITDRDWASKLPFSENAVCALVDRAGKRFDELLYTLGYERVGEYYRVLEEKPYDTVAVFSHAGFSCAVISHIFNLPFPFVCNSLNPDVTAITIASFANAKIGTLVSPSFEIACDARHIKGITEGTVIQK